MLARAVLFLDGVDLSEIATTLLLVMYILPVGIWHTKVSKSPSSSWADKSNNDLRLFLASRLDGETQCQVPVAANEGSVRNYKVRVRSDSCALAATKEPQADAPRVRIHNYLAGMVVHIILRHIGPVLARSVRVIVCPGARSTIVSTSASTGACSGSSASAGASSASGSANPASSTAGSASTAAALSP